MTNHSSSLYNGIGSDKAATNLDSSISTADNSKLTLTINELAYHLNVSRATAYNLARRNDFYPAIRIGHRLIVSKHALERWLDEQTEG